MKAFCLFEQSGTFKKEFIKLGIPAKDYDIQNEFGETDIVCDLFSEIAGGYNGEPSIFDEIEKSDVVFAFFPCTKFSTRTYVNARGENPGMAQWSDEKKLEYSKKTFAEIAKNYDLICKLVIIALRKGFALIIENPNASKHILKDFFPIRPKVVDNDRTKRGDAFVKPTKFYFINRAPAHNFIWEPQPYIKDIKTVDGTRNTTERSMITGEYANRFIREFIL